MKNKNLILSGGGARGVFQAGVLTAIFDDVKFSKVYGTSAGALNMMVLAQCYLNNDNSLFEKLFFEEMTKTNKVFSKNYLKLMALGKPFSFKPLIKIIDKHIDFERIAKMDEEFIATSTDLVSGESFFASSHQLSPENFKKAIIASASIPPAFPPVELGNRRLVDGGVRENVPTKFIVDAPDEKYVIVLCAPMKTLPQRRTTKCLNLINIANRVIGIMMDEITSNDVNGIITINKILKQYEEKHQDADKPSELENKKIWDVEIIAPNINVTDDILDFSPEKLKPGFEIGLRHGRRFLESIHDIDGVYSEEDIPN